MARITEENFQSLFHVDTIRTNLEQKSVRSGVARVAAQGLQFLLGVGATMVLARLLAPEAYGLRDMVTVLIAFVGSFRDFGLTTAVINREAINHTTMSRLFWINLGLNSALLLFMLAMAPVLVWWFQEPLLWRPIAFMAVGVFLLGLSSQHQTLLQRQMRHDLLSTIETVALLAGVVVAVALAWLGFGAWALIWQLWVTMVLQSVVAWIACGWLPSSPWRNDDEALGDIFTFGTHVTLARVVAHVGRNLDRVLVGRYGGAVNMGLYGQAYRWSLFPLQQAYTPLLNVAVSGLSRVQTEPERYRTYFKRGLLPVYAIIFPMLGFMIIDAPEVVALILGDQWQAAVPLLRILTVAALFESINRVTKWLYLAQGETKRQLHWGLIYTPAMIAAVVIGAQWGTLGVGLGFTVGTVVLTVPGLAYCLQRSHVTLSDFVEILWRPTVATAGAGLCSELLWQLPPINVIVDLGSHLVLFGLSYLVIWLVLPGGRATMRQILALRTMLRV